MKYTVLLLLALAGCATAHPTNTSPVEFLPNFREKGRPFAECWDGRSEYYHKNRSTCRRHGGVKKWFYER